MARKELVKIESFQGETKNSQIFVMSMDTKGMSLYEKAKNTEKFINRETKVLEQVLESIVRNFLRENGIIVQDGSHKSLEHALWELEQKGKVIDIVDRYEDLHNDTIIGQSPNLMTIVEEESIVSCAMEIVIYERDDATT